MSCPSCWSAGAVTILVSVIAGVAATVLAVLFGVTAGYFGGGTDDLLSMLANIFLVLPALPLLIVIFGFLGKGANPNDLVIGVIIAITGWAFGARQLRAQTLSMRNRDFVDSARIIGEKSWRIMTFEILPNLIPVVATSFLFTVIYGVGTFTALSFLGVINTSHWSWGTMLYWAQSAQAAQQVHLEWWWFVPPGLAVGLFGTGLALLNFGIDEFVNPRLRGARALRPCCPAGRAAAAASAGPDSGAAFGSEGIMNSSDILLSVRGLCVDYGLGDEAVHAVVDADLELRAARRWAWPGRAAAASPPWPTRSPGCCGRRGSSPRARRTSARR